MPVKTGPKTGPKQGQNVSKSKKFKILNEDKKDYNKIPTLFVCLLVLFGLNDPQKPKNKRAK